jgi:hypothetical protein
MLSSGSPTIAPLVVRLALLALPACGDSDSSADDADADADSASDGDSDGDGEDDAPSLLERALTPTWDCAPAFATHNLLASGAAFGGDIAPAGAGFLTVVCSDDPFGPSGSLAAVRVQPIDAAGALGPTRDVVTDRSYVRACQLAPAGADAAVVWLEATVARPEMSIQMARVDASGAVVDGPREVVPPSSGYPFEPHRLVPLGEDAGVALLWAQSDGLHVRVIEPGDERPADASFVVTPDLPTAARGVATSDGLLVTWSADAGAGSEVFVVATDTQGAATGETTRLGRAASASLETRNGDLARVGDGYVAALSESVTRGDPSTGDSAPDGPWWHPDDWSMESTILLQRLDASGATVGPLERVQASVPHLENVGPALAALGDDVALTWSSGRVIYVCGGCMRDDELRVVVLRADDLLPVSAVVAIPPDGVHGSFQARLTIAGTSLGMIYSQDYHATSRLGVATGACARR